MGSFFQLDHSLLGGEAGVAGENGWGPWVVGRCKEVGRNQELKNLRLGWRKQDLVAVKDSWFPVDFPWFSPIHWRQELISISEKIVASICMQLQDASVRCSLLSSSNRDVLQSETSTLRSSEWHQFLAGHIIIIISHMGVSENSVPLNPMVLLILIAMKNGYFIINPTFSDKPISYPRLSQFGWVFSWELSWLSPDDPLRTW